MAVDLNALVRAIQEDPQQRAVLRRALIGDEADVFEALNRLSAAQERTELALGSLTVRVDALAEAQARTEAHLGVLTARMDTLAARMDELSKDVRQLVHAQQATETAVKGLLDVVSGMNDRLARLDGESLERRYRERGHAYFQRIATRLRQVDPDKFSALVDDGRRSGALTELDAESLLYADGVFTGRRRDDDQLVHLVVEASVTIARHDVRRARERADLLARIVDTPVIAIVAGEFAPEPVAIAAHDADVWRVTNGNVMRPGEDEEFFH